MTSSHDKLSDSEIAKRRDAAVRRALNTPPKPYKDSKKGAARKKREDDEHPTASDVKRT